MIVDYQTLPGQIENDYFIPRLNSSIDTQGATNRVRASSVLKAVQAKAFVKR